MTEGRALRRARSIGAILLGLAIPAGQGAKAAESGWRGVVKALHQPAITTELVAPIAEIKVREGMRFKRGETLLAFDCRRQGHELAALDALKREAQIAKETTAYLLSRNAAHRQDVEIAAARFDKALAEWQAMQQKLLGCTIVAPFDGAVVELTVSAHETPPPNKPLMVLTSIGDLEIEVIVPSRQLFSIDQGAALRFRADDTGTDHRARIVRTGGAVDAVSQTVKIYAQFVESPDRILPGMSGTVTLREGE